MWDLSENWAYQKIINESGEESIHFASEFTLQAVKLQELFKNVIELSHYLLEEWVSLCD